MEFTSASSSVASDDSDVDAGLLSALLGLPSFGLAQRTSESSDFSYYSVVDSLAGLTQTCSALPISFPPSGVAGFGHG